MKAKLTNFCNYLSILSSSKVISDLQRMELEGRLSKFDSLYDEFDDLQTEIEVDSDMPQEAYASVTNLKSDTIHLLLRHAACWCAPTLTKRNPWRVQQADMRVNHTNILFAYLRLIYLTLMVAMIAGLSIEILSYH